PATFLSHGAAEAASFAVDALSLHAALPIYAVAHHVVQHAAALHPSNPEPGRVGAAVLLGGAGQVRTAGDGGTAAPDDVVPAREPRLEELILQVSVQHAGLLDQLDGAASLLHVAGQRLLAGHADQLSLAGLEGADDLLQILNAPVIRSADPDRIDGGAEHHVRDGRVRLRLAHAQLTRVGRRRFGILPIRAPDAQNVRIPHGLPGKDVKACDEAASNDANAKSFFRHAVLLRYRYDEWKFYRWP